MQDLGVVKDFTYDLYAELTDKSPIHCKARRFPHKENEFINAHVQELHSLGILEPSTSD